MCVYPIDGEQVDVRISVHMLMAFAVYIAADANPAGGIWTGVERGDGQGTTVDGQVCAWRCV